MRAQFLLGPEDRVHICADYVYAGRTGRWFIFAVDRTGDQIGAAVRHLLPWRLKR